MQKIFLTSFSVIFFVLHAFAQTVPNDSAKVINGEILQHVAYGTQPSWMVSSSVSEIKGSDLEKSFTLDLGSTLYGRLPGLTVMQGGGEPGLQSPSLRIRGTNTFGSGKGILVIVDGFESSMSALVPEEVESVTILKDAAATAMYGSRGANGVLLVTTKRGQQGSLKISFSTHQGFNAPIDLPKMLGSYDYARLYNEALRNDGSPELYTSNDLEAYRTGSDSYFHPNVNWFNEVLRETVPVSNYDLNFSGGNETVKYFVLLNYKRSSGLYKKFGDESENSINSNYNRFNYRSNVDIQLSKRFSTSLILGGSVTDKTNPAANTTADIFSTLASMPPNVFPVYNPNGTLSGNTAYDNPAGDLLESGFYTSNGRTFQGTLSFTEKLDMITKGLSLTGAVSFNNSFTSLSNKSRTYLKYQIGKDSEGNVVYSPIGINTSLIGAEGYSDQWRSYSVRTDLNYTRLFGENKMDAIIMANSDNYVTNGINGLPYLHQGVFGRYTFSTKEKYIAEFSFGYESSDGFPKGKRWGFFPAGSLGWVVSNESFLADCKNINYLKIRGSYGLTGNDNIGGNSRYLFLQDYISANGYLLGKTSNTWNGGITEGQIANPNVTWEKQEQLNVGLEVTVFNRIDLTLDVFNQGRYNILCEPELNVPAISGVISPQLNVGKTNNKGFEATVRYNGKTANLQYFIQGAVWYAKNKIVYNSEALQLYDYLYATGRPIGQALRLEAIGFFENSADIANSPKQTFTEVQPGDIKYKDQNDDGIIDQYDYYPVGKPNMPNLTASLNVGLKSKGFDFEMLLQGITNSSVYLNGPYFHAFQNNASVTEFALNRWTPETAATASYPRLSAENNLNNFQSSSFWQKDGSFIKLRSAELGYTLPESLIKKIKLDNARVFVNGTNLFSWDHLDFSDPETIYGYPPVRTISIGARVQF